MSVRFHLPNFVDRFNGSMNMTLILMIKRMPRMFYDGVEIASVFDCFPMIWNGGRIMAGYMDMQTVDKLVPQYLGRFNSLGVPCRLTLTNPLLTREHLNDPVCNRVLDIADNGMNEAIVFSPLLEEHIRKRHPNMKMISSTCKQIRGLEPLIEELKKDYSLVVLDYNWNNDFEALEKIPEEYRGKIEVLVCPYCFPDCKRRGDHYKFLGEQQIKRSSINAFGNIGGINMLNVQTEENFRCEAISRNFLETIEFSTHITPETLFEKYVPMGFRHFKIEGRTLHPLNVIESYVYYMTKPEYKDLVRLKLGLDTFRAR